jgi:ribonuclease E
MSKELLVNVSRGEEVRVALIEDGRLEEIYLERDDATSSVGNVYLGKVTNVEGSIQAAFVDFGYGRNGFLHVQDLHPDYFPDGGRWDKMSERVGKKIGRRDRPPIQDCLRRGDQIVVQIIKEGIGTKGPTLTSYPSIPGRFLVAMPGVGQMGVSKNIEDEPERRRLRKILDTLEPPKDVGFIIRTAGMGKTKAEIERDFKYLVRVWQEIDKQRKRAKPPALLYSEGDLVTRVVRDVYSNDVGRLVVDDVETALRIKQFFKLLMPRTKVDVRLYEGQVPLFHAAGIEHEIETMFSRHVPLGNGGSLVIDSTEAVVAIDVNSGKFREHGDAEETAFRMDLEAADEICRQLRLRDLGGVVIVDFIDLRYARHRQALHDRLTDNFKRDKAKSRHLMMSEFGIVEITRQRMRPDLKKSVFMACPWSRGTGLIKTPQSMALDVLRRLRVALADERVARVSVRLYPTAAMQVLNTKRRSLAGLEKETGVEIEIRVDDTLPADGIEFDLFDDRDVAVQVAGLKGPEVEAPDQGHTRRRRRRRKGSESGEKEAAPAATELDDDGLIELDELVSLGELKLEAVEDLVSQAAAEREHAEADPMDSILNALRDPPEGMADDQADDDDSGDGPETGKRRRRRRRRRGGADDQPADDVQDDQAAPAPQADDPPVDRADDEAADEDSDGTKRRRRRRRRRGATDDEDRARPQSDDLHPAPESEEESEDEQDAPTPEPTPEAEPRPRRRRSRGRLVKSRPLALETALPVEEPEPQEPDEPEESDELEPEAVEPESTQPPEPEPAPKPRRRRGGKVVRSRPVAVATAVPIAPDPTPPKEPEPSDDDDEPAEAPAPGPKKTTRKKATKSAKTAKTPKSSKTAKTAKKATKKAAKLAKKTTRKKASDAED